MATQSNEVKNIFFLFLSNYRVDNNCKCELEKEKIYYNKNEYKIKAIQSNEPAVFYINEKCKNIGKHGLDKIFMFVSNMIKTETPYKNNCKEKDILPKNSHLEIFKRRVRTKLSLGDTDNFFAQVDYKEPKLKVDKGEPVPKDWNYDKNEDDFTAACDMARMIQTYCKYPDKKIETIADVDAILSDTSNEPLGKKYQVRLYVDMTGGLRHANMLMLAVIDLLKYTGIEVCDIIYSNLQKKDKDKQFDEDFGKIEEVTNIYNVFQLVSGVKEFTKYGSINTLNTYFNNVQKKLKEEKSEKKLSDELDSLRVDMKNFSETLKFCRAGAIKNSIKKIKKDIASYKKIGDTNTMTEEEKVFKILIPMIENKYKNLYKNSTIDIIEWCMENKFYQQALTFFTELIPIDLFEDFDKGKNKNKNKAFSIDPYFAKVEELDKNKNDNSWQYYLLRSYYPKHKASENKYRETVTEEQSRLYMIFYGDEYSSHGMKLLDLSNTVDTNQEPLPFHNFNEDVKNINIDFVKKAEVRREAFKRLLDRGFVKTNICLDNALNIVFLYNEIVELRNKVNHANKHDDDFDIIKMINEELEKAINVLKNIEAELANKRKNN